MERRKKGLISEYKMGRIQKLLKRLWYTRKGRQKEAYWTQELVEEVVQKRKERQKGCIGNEEKEKEQR